MNSLSPTHGDYFRELFDHLGAAVVAGDVQLCIQHWNRAATRMFGASEESMLASPVVSVFPADFRESADILCRQALTTGGTSQLEFQDRDAEGKHRELAATIAPIVTHAGHRVGVSVCFRDITKRIAMQTELLESRKMASLGEMAGAVAHHFNNILAGLVTSVDYATSVADNPVVVRRVLEQASQAAMRASTLVNGLLAVARGDTHLDDLADLTELLNELGYELEQTAGLQSVSFELKVESMPVVPIPKSPVHTILQNITRNAMEAMPEGGRLCITARVEDGSAIVTVTDSGKGMDEYARQRIFEPFWSTKHDAQLGGRAAGLGLAVAYGLARVIGATISVESEPNRGSCFTVRIPLSPLS
ncbi:MAG: ATP-binding protein [Planctomycetota bacterium]